MKRELDKQRAYKHVYNQRERRRRYGNAFCHNQIYHHKDGYAGNIRMYYAHSESESGGWMYWDDGSLFYMAPPL